MNLPADEQYLAPGTRARVRIERPDDIRLSFELTMTAAEWRHLMRQLPADGSAAGQIGRMIANMLGGTLGHVERKWLAGGYVISAEEEA